MTVELTGFLKIFIFSTLKKLHNVNREVIFGAQNREASATIPERNGGKTLGASAARGLGRRRRGVAQ